MLIAYLKFMKWLFVKSSVFAVILSGILFFAGCAQRSKFDPRIAGLNNQVLISLENFGNNSADSGAGDFSLALTTKELAVAGNILEGKGSFNGYVAALVPEAVGRGVGVIFRDGAIFKIEDPEFKTLELVVEGTRKLEILTAAKVGGELFAIGRDTGKEWGLYRFSDSVWVRSNMELPILEFSDFAIAELAEYQGEMVLFWRELVGRKIEPLLRMARYENGSWVMLPELPADNDMIGGFAICTSGKSLLLVQDAGGFAKNRVGGMPLYEYYEGKGWSMLPDVPFSQNKMGLKGYGIDIKLIGDKYAVARSDESGLRLYYSADIENGIWTTVNIGESVGEKTDVFESSSILNYVMLFCTFVLLGIFIRKNRRRKVLAKLREQGADEQSANAGFEQMLRAIRIARIGGLASVFDRGLALMIDGVLVALVPFYYLNSTSDDFVESVLVSGELYIFFLWLGALSIYAFVAELLYGQTVGKAVMRIRVRSAGGGKPKLLQVFVRNSARFIDFFPIPIGGARIWYLVALVTASFSRKRQRVGDILAQTMVRRHTPLKKRKIVLASASPRRKELLTELGLEFDVVVSDVDESRFVAETPSETAVLLAKEKANRIAGSMENGELVIAADTVVAIGEKVLGKPENKENAIEMLTALSGVSHEVITGICIIDTATTQILAAYDLTEVEFKELSDVEIESYVDSGEGEDKAGSYAIQGRGGYFVKNTLGSTSNVIGMPMELLGRMFDDLDA